MLVYGMLDLDVCAKLILGVSFTVVKPSLNGDNDEMACKISNVGEPGTKIVIKE